MTQFLSGTPIILAPMAGVTDPVFRMLCEEQGADITFTEMVSAKGLSFANQKTRHLLDVMPGTTCVAVQIFGHEPDTMADQARWIEQELGPLLSHIDINMGCPAPKIVKKGDGSALMKTPDFAADIVSAVKSAVNVPVTCKFRRGWNEATGETAPLFAERMQQAGADAVCVHGRFAMQYYQGTSDIQCIARVKRAVTIPVIGNGDVRCGEDAQQMLATTGCDALMIARASEGNPWVFSQVKAHLANRPFAAPSLDERISLALRHIKLLLEIRPHATSYLRKHAMWYLKGVPGAAAARGALSTCSSYEEFENVFLALQQFHNR